MARVALAVDDDPAVLYLIADMLEDLGCEVICAHNGTDALAVLARDQRIEILITDINMPGIAGTSLPKKQSVCGMVSTRSYSPVARRIAMVFQ